jgi:hypothetical protein
MSNIFSPLDLDPTIAWWCQGAIALPGPIAIPVVAPAAVAGGGGASLGSGIGEGPEL